MRRASRRLLWSGGARQRAGARARRAPRRPRCALSRQRERHQSQGLGVHVFSAGDFLGAPGTESVVLSDQGLGTYRKLVIAGGRVVGAVLYGDTADSFWYLDLIRSGAAIDSVREDLIFGRALGKRPRAAGVRATKQLRGNGGRSTNATSRL